MSEVTVTKEGFISNACVDPSREFRVICTLGGQESRFVFGCDVTHAGDIDWNRVINYTVSYIKEQENE